MFKSSSAGALSVTKGGTGTYRNFQVQTAGSTQLTIDVSGNYGLGTTSFGGAIKALSLVTATQAPVSTPTSAFVLFVDPADNKLKAKGPSGTTTTLANP